MRLRRLFSIRMPEYAFLICGFIGLLFALPLTLALIHFLGLFFWVEAVVILCALFVLLAAPLTVKIFTGREELVFYRDVICIFISIALALRFMHQPLLPYLDVTIAGAGIFHAFGRIGCLVAGCCYGRPCRVGVRYTHAHAEMGFPRELVGVRLFPIQLIESVWILCLAGLVSYLALRFMKPGLALSVYVTGYAIGRYFFEFARGDAERPYLAGFSHAQWISLLLVACVNMASLADILPRFNLLLIAPFVLVVTMLLVRLFRFWLDGDCFNILHPRHILEIAKVLHRLTLSFSRPQVVSSLSHPTSSIEIVTTSLGLRISANRVRNHGYDVFIYSLSREQNLLSSRCAHFLGKLISHLQRNSATYEVCRGSHGVWHILLTVRDPEMKASQLHFVRSLS